MNPIEARFTQKGLSNIGKWHFQTILEKIYFIFIVIFSP